MRALACVSEHEGEVGVVVPVADDLFDRVDVTFGHFGLERGPHT